MSTSFEVSGTLVHVGTTQLIKDTFQKRAFVVEVSDGNYPQQIQFEVTKDRCSSLDAYKVGDELKVLFNIRGRGYDKKDGSGRAWFTSLEAWKVEQQGQRQLGDTDKGARFDDVPF